MLGVEELLQIEEEIKDDLTEILTRLNRTDRLLEFLSFIGKEELLQENPEFKFYKNRQILVIGESDVKKEHLIRIAKDKGITKDRLEMHLDYDAGKKFDFRTVQWNDSYSAIIVGPIGHSGISKGDYSSVITAIEGEEGYPPVYRMQSNGRLKITKSNFGNMLSELIRDQIITV